MRNNLKDGNISYVCMPPKEDREGKIYIDIYDVATYEKIHDYIRMLADANQFRYEQIERYQRKVEEIEKGRRSK